MPQLSLIQYLRMIWARKWLVLAVFVVVASAGIALVLSLPKSYTANASLVVEIRPDPILGPLSTPFSLATELEILRSEKVAARVVRALGLDQDPVIIASWKRNTQGDHPIDRYLATAVLRDMKVEPVRGSNVLNVSFTSLDPATAAKGANAIAQAAIDVSLEMRVEPARQSAAWFDEQTKSLRTELEEAQTRLSRYQREKGIVVTDERLDLEVSRLNTLSAELATALAERAAAQGRQRNTGDASPDVMMSPAVQMLRSQLGAAETRLSEVSRNLGPNHPQRIQLEVQVGELRQQLEAEVRRTAAGTTVASRVSAQKVEALRALVETQKQRILAMRSERDQASVLLRDVERAQRAYDQVSQRGGQLNLESQLDRSILRMLSPAVQPMEYSSRKVKLGILASIGGALLLGMAGAVALELLDRRVRGVEDLVNAHGVQLIGVIEPPGVKRPRYRSLPHGGPTHGRPVLPQPGAG